MGWEIVKETNAIEPQVYDVMFGSDSGARNHYGTLRFQEIIQSKARRYAAVEKRHKRSIAVEIMRCIQKTGRFIRLSTVEWQVVPDEIILTTIDRAIRCFNNRYNAGGEAPLNNRKKWNIETNQKSMERDKESARSARYKSYPTTNKQSIGDGISQNLSESTFNERRNGNFSLRKFLRTAKLAVETTELEISNVTDYPMHEFSIDSMLHNEYSDPVRLGSNDNDDTSGLPNTTDSRQQYMDFLCSQNGTPCTDMEDDRKQPPDFACDPRNDVNFLCPFTEIMHHTSNGSLNVVTPTLDKKTLKHAPCGEALDKPELLRSLSAKSHESRESDIDLDYVPQPLDRDGVDYLQTSIDVDESISNFLNDIDDGTLNVNDGDNDGDDDKCNEVRLEYKKQLSEFINQAILEVAAIDDNKPAQSDLVLSPTVAYRQEDNGSSAMNNIDEDDDNEDKNDDNGKLSSLSLPINNNNAATSTTKCPSEHNHRSAITRTNNSSNDCSCRSDMQHRQETNAVSPLSPKCLS